jgi:riboflavin synthase
MFTGIVQGLGRIAELDKKENSMSFTVELPEKSHNKIELGASIAINGCCLTVVETNQTSAKFDVIDESLGKTNLGALKLGSVVNVERAATFADEIGGHLVSGHVLATCNVVDIKSDDENTALYLSIPKVAQDYIFTKGFIGLNGCSLTIGDLFLTEQEHDSFSIHLIPETLKMTTFGTMKIGDKVNLEVDAQIQAVVDTVKRMKLSGQL